MKQHVSLLSNYHLDTLGETLTNFSVFCIVC